MLESSYVLFERVLQFVVVLAIIVAAIQVLAVYLIGGYRKQIQRMERRYTGWHRGASGDTLDRRIQLVRSAMKFEGATDTAEAATALQEVARLVQILGAEVVRPGNEASGEARRSFDRPQNQ